MPSTAPTVVEGLNLFRRLWRSYANPPRLHCAAPLGYAFHMGDLTPVIEAMEHRWMRSWVNRDVKSLKAITTRDFILLVGAKPAAILDRPSFLEAAVQRWDCESYRFGDVLVRDESKIAIFSAALELKASLGASNWSGSFWLTDVWRKGRVRRGWKLAHRLLSRRDEAPELSKAIKGLQLWK